MEKSFRELIQQLGDVKCPMVTYESFALAFDENHMPEVVTTLHQYVKSNIDGSEITHTAISKNRIISSEKLLNKTKKDRITIVQAIKDNEMNSFTSLVQSNFSDNVNKNFHTIYDKSHNILAQMSSQDERDEFIYGIFCVSCCVGQYIWSKNMRETCRKYLNILTKYLELEIYDLWTYTAYRNIDTILNMLFSKGGDSSRKLFYCLTVFHDGARWT